MAMIGWLLIVENGGGVTDQRSIAYSAVPASQALLESPSDVIIQPINRERAIERSVAGNGWSYFVLTTPAHANGVKINVKPVDGDVDLYVREGGLPEGDVDRGGVFDASSALQGQQTEEVRLAEPGAHDWYIAVHGVRASEFSLEAEIN